MAYWLFKSEPDVFGWDHLVAKWIAEWDGVRNYQARNFMRDMAVGNQGFFYHSRTGLNIVGILRVVASAHPDSTAADPKWVCVDVQADRPLPHPVSLDTIKADPALADMVLVRNSRLSVQPVTDAAWRHILRLGGLDPDQA